MDGLNFLPSLGALRRVAGQRARRNAWTAAALVLAAAGCREAQSATRNERLEALNEAQALSAASRAPHEDRAFPEFAARFERIASVRAPLSTAPTGTAPHHRPDLCTLAPDGSVYLAAAGYGAIHAWRGGAALVPFATATAPPRSVADLFWDPARETLYVLDGARAQVRRYTPSGELAGFAAVNAGQLNAGLVVTESGRLVMGGIRQEAPGRNTLVSIHDAQGRHQASFVDMDSAMMRSKLRAAPPVHLSAAGGETFLAAEPSRPRIQLLDTSGRVLRTVDARFEGYRAMTPLTQSGFDLSRAQAWVRGWDRLVFVHAGPRHTYAAFQSWRGPRPRYRVEVYDRDGTRVETGLRHESIPVCGRGDELVLVSQGREDEVEITRWRYRGPDGRATASPHPEGGRR